MTRGTRVAQRYAKALILEAQRTEKFEVVAKDVAFVLDTIKNSRDLQLFLNSPVVRPEVKEELLDKLFKGKVDSLLLDFFHLLAKKGRENELYGVCICFEEQYLIIKNIATVNLTSSVKLTDDVKSKVVADLGASLNKEIRLEEEIDETLIGGLVIRYEDKQLDLSVKSALRRVKENLAV